MRDRIGYCLFVCCMSSDSEAFRALHPITTYEHYRELIQRIAAGEQKVIIAERPLILAMTSGTSGPSAMLLSTKATNAEFFLQVKSLLHLELSHVPGNNSFSSRGWLCA